jgi:hypothetical protein
MLGFKGLRYCMSVMFQLITARPNAKELRYEACDLITSDDV